MRLRDLLKYNDIVIQCHNNPDADAIASGFAVYTYLKNNNKNVRLVYAGANPITKSNLCLMTETLNIPICHVRTLEPPELLITVDCQYGEGNVTRFEAENIAIIDHHQPAVDFPKLCEIRSNLCSCSTVVWDMLRSENIDISSDRNLSTALYYGLLTDSNNFTEISHPLDKDLRDEAVFERNLIIRYRNTNLSLSELVIAGKALLDYQYNEKFRFSVVEAEPCDPNILGMISDLVLEVDVVDTCLVYSILPSGIKLSVRSCIKEVKANEMVAFVTNGIGSGGGHLTKAGGFIHRSKVNCTDANLSAYFTDILTAYFSDTEIINAAEYTADTSDMQLYHKLPVSLGYARLTDLVPEGTSINIRTLETDMDFVAEDDIYITIGIAGEIYPTRKEKFEKNYILSDTPYIFRGEYEPTVKDILNGTSLSLIPYAKTCIATGGGEIYARRLDHRVKVFTAWDDDKYMLGCPGDYLAVRKDDLHDVYIIQGEIFSETYEK